ncbi:MAG: hypothetical protein ACTTKH_05380 [Treponema sp.]
MKKLFIFIFTVCFSFYAEASIENAYYTFLEFNYSFVNTAESILTKQHSIKNENNKNNFSYVYCLHHKKGQCVRLITNTKTQYFFRADSGYYLYTNKLKSPLKISGAYQVEEFEIQDLLKIDFKNEYSITEINDNIILERQTKKSPYKFISFMSTSDDTYELTFLDNKKNPIRKLIYHAGNVDGVHCFKQIDAYNLLFNKNISWVTESIQKVNIPSSLFAISKIKQLAEQMDSILKDHL